LAYIYIYDIICINYHYQYFVHSIFDTISILSSLLGFHSDDDADYEPPSSTAPAPASAPPPLFIYICISLSLVIVVFSCVFTFVFTVWFYYMLFSNISAPVGVKLHFDCMVFFDWENV
jgi:hypothetical protein